ncbi:MAG: NUDIX domain-containing protein [Defluviitaleaceae bacterium]|nr:NUDIX domain-containing protein [Defluviitaleaceae bacterium]
MITTRIKAAAFLTCGNKVLLLKRGLHKKLAPGLWAGIGGHMELDEITDPRAFNLMETCLREIHEETGINRADIRGLKLRYIATRRDGHEIFHHYKFIGELDNEVPLPHCNEGELHWVERDAALTLPMGITVRVMYRHWMQNPHEDKIFMAVIDGSEEEAALVALA